MLVLFLFLAIISRSSSQEECPNKWIFHDYSSTCYHVTKTAMKIDEARAFCAQLENSSHLLRVEAATENAFVGGILPPNNRVWVDARARFDIVDGAASLYSPGFAFRWPNGKVVRFSKWANANGVASVSRRSRCVQMNGSALWFNADCNGEASVVCEKKLHYPHDKTCPKHWTYWETTGSCYRAISKTNMTMLDADNRCFNLGFEHDAILASIHSKEENEFIARLARDKNPHFDFIMIGGYGRSNNGQKWHWMDGSRFDFYNWDRGMPFGKRALAVLVMNRRAKWINQFADKILSQFDAVAVCKFKP